MNQLAIGVSDMFRDLSPAAWGAVFGTLGTLILSYVGSVVTHAGNRRSSRLARLEKSAVVDLRDLTLSGAEIGGKVVNFGQTPARDVRVEFGGAIRFYSVVDVRESLLIHLPIASSTGSASCVITYRDFAGSRHERSAKIEWSNGDVRVIGPGQPEKGIRAWFARR